MFWQAGVSLFTPLPFRPSIGGFGENFRTHLFTNVGNIGSFKIGKNWVNVDSRLNIYGFKNIVL